jgi:outer membrane protein assembly factor BamB
MSHSMLFGAITLACVAASAGFADERADWTSWRGPTNDGSAGQGNYPDAIEAGKAVWRAELPGKGCSTPIVWKDQIYLTAPVEGKDAVLRYDMQGKETWRTVFGPEDAGKHRNGSGSNASPVTDGTALFAYFKSGTLAAVALDGTVLWKTNLVERFGKDTLFWDHGTSPVLTDDYVVLARMHQGESWLAAFDKRTGELAWKVARNYQTPTECDHGYTTPLVLQWGGKEAILVWGAEHVTIHQAVDGNVLWNCGNFNPEGNQLWPAIATPVIVGNMVVIAYGRNDRGIPRLFGIQLDGKGDVTATNHVWQRNDVGTFVPTPAVQDGKLILVRDHGEVECVDPATGKTIWKDAFPKNRSNFYASPLIAGDKIYAAREDGAVFVASIANGQFKILSQSDLGEPVIGSAVPAGDRILLRGEQHLFCFARQE